MLIKLKWFGHSFWKISLDDVSIIIDPFDDIGYTLPVGIQGDIVVVSHNHHDHNNISLIKKPYTLYNQPGKYSEDDINLELIPLWHDEDKGAKRGINHLVKITYKGISILHCGDLGHVPDRETIEQLNKIDVILIPVGGIYTIDAQKAKALCDKIKPKVIIPMHYKTKVLKFELDPVEKFTSLFDGVIKKYSSEVELTDNFLADAKSSVLTLNYA